MRSAQVGTGTVGERGQWGSHGPAESQSPIFLRFPAPHPAPRPRLRLVDRLLARYADYWGMRWVNLLLVDRDPLFPKGAFAYDRWVRDAFRANMPFDRFAAEILTGAGETYRDGPANFYRALASPEERGRRSASSSWGPDRLRAVPPPSLRAVEPGRLLRLAAFFARVREKGALGVRAGRLPRRRRAR